MAFQLQFEHMDNSDAAAKLKARLDEGKSYYEASNLLRQEGFSSLQIDDAKITLDKQYVGKYRSTRWQRR